MGQYRMLELYISSTYGSFGGNGPELQEIDFTYRSK